MEKVAGMEDARGEQRRVGGSSLLRFRGRDGRGMQHQAREEWGGSVSCSEAFHVVRSVCTEVILEAKH